MKHHYNTILLSSFTLLSCSVALASDDALWKVSQTDFGGTGLLQMPTARMANEGEFNLGVSINEDYYHYTASLQLMEWLETTIRYTRIPDTLYNPNPDYSGDNINTDKGIDLKVRFLQEGYWVPDVSIGVRDIGGTGLFDGEYLAATKRVGPLDFSLGFGWGYLGQSNNVANPLCKYKDQFCTRSTITKDNGGSVDFGRWFNGPSAIFGGVEYQTPYKPLRLKIEYDGNDYTQDYPVKAVKKPMPQHTSWNFGLNYRLGDWGDAKLSYQRGDTLTLGFNLYTNFNEMKAVWRDEDKPAVQLRPNPENTNWDEVSLLLEKNAGYKLNTISKADGTITLQGEQAKYRDRNEALDRAAAILNNHSDPSVTQFHIVET